jgi:hypothetical protein
MPPAIQVPIRIPTTIRIRIAFNATAMPSTIPFSISCQGCPRRRPISAATMAPRIKGIWGGPSKTLI